MANPSPKTLKYFDNSNSIPAPYGVNVPFNQENEDVWIGYDNATGKLCITNFNRTVIIAIFSGSNVSVNVVAKGGENSLVDSQRTDDGTDVSDDIKGTYIELANQKSIDDGDTVDANSKRSRYYVPLSDQPLNIVTGPITALIADIKIVGIGIGNEEDEVGVKIDVTALIAGTILNSVVDVEAFNYLGGITAEVNDPDGIVISITPNVGFQMQWMVVCNTAQMFVPES
jgi:hypothetical protein